MIWAIAQLSTKETQFFGVMKVIDGAVLPEFSIEEFGKNNKPVSTLVAINEFPWRFQVFASRRNLNFFDKNKF